MKAVAVGGWHGIKWWVSEVHGHGSDGLRVHGGHGGRKAADGCGSSRSSAGWGVIRAELSVFRFNTSVDGFVTERLATEEHDSVGTFVFGVESGEPLALDFFAGGCGFGWAARKLKKLFDFFSSDVIGNITEDESFASVLVFWSDFFAIFGDGEHWAGTHDGNDEVTIDCFVAKHVFDVGESANQIDGHKLVSIHIGFEKTVGREVVLGKVEFDLLLESSTERRAFERSHGWESRGRRHAKGHGGCGAGGHQPGTRNKNTGRRRHFE
jgi:hypothetical protein